MRKLIKKYQIGGENISLPTYGYNKENLSNQFMNKIDSSWLTNLLSFKGSPNITAFTKSGSNLSNYTKTMNNQITTPQLKGLGAGTNLFGGKTASGSTATKSSFSLNKLGDVGGTVSGLVGGIFDAAGLKSSTMGSTKSVFDTLASSVSSFGTVGKIAGLVLNGVGLVDKYAGRNLKKQGTDANLAIAGYTPQMSVQAGGKTSFFKMGRKKGIDAQTKRADANNLKAANATYFSNRNNLAAANNYGDIVTKTQQQLGGGIKTNILSSKKGGRINPAKLGDIVNKAKHKIKKAQEGIPTDDLQKMQNGGQITNVIPEGALHARKNNYEGKLKEQITSKGIPVISIEEGGKIVQHAEIEHSEIIFNKKVSTQLEDWFKKYNKIEDPKEKESLEIECGKLLAYEILNNTDDNTGILG